MNMVSRNRSTIDPSYLLPSPRAFCFHGMRVYHQTLVWRRLLDNDSKFYTLQGWKQEGEKPKPTMRGIAVDLHYIHKFIRCSCKLKWRKKCSCVKFFSNGLHPCANSDDQKTIQDIELFAFRIVLSKGIKMSDVIYVSTHLHRNVFNFFALKICLGKVILLGLIFPILLFFFFIFFSRVFILYGNDSMWCNLFHDWMFDELTTD